MKIVCLCCLLPFMLGIVVVAKAYNTTAMQVEESKKSLLLRGRVVEVELARENKHSLAFRLHLALEFINTSDKPIIILQRKPWLGAEALARSPEDAKARKYLYISSHWPSVYTSPAWQELRQQLDQPNPPSALTRTLSPGEVFPYEMATILYIEKAGSFDKTSQNWDTIRKVSPLWLEISVEVWPINIEPRVDPNNLEFGRLLQQRWRQFGELQLERLSSEPMPIDLSTPVLDSNAH